MRRRTSGSLSPTPCTRSTARRSICAFRCFRGRIFVRPRRRSKCTRFSIGPIPSFIHVSVGKMGDARALDMIAPEAGSIYVMDRGYVDFRRLNVFHHRVYSHAVDKTTGVRADQSVALDGFYTRKDYSQHMRRISFCDPETGKRLVFLTNNFVLPAETIAALYKKRWQVELFFKWIKQNLRIKHFYGGFPSLAAAWFPLSLKAAARRSCRWRQADSRPPDRRARRR